jgi:hypothetical protein
MHLQHKAVENNNYRPRRKPSKQVYMRLQHKAVENKTVNYKRTARLLKLPQILREFFMPFFKGF